MHRDGPKKLLAIDGGGIRGVLSLEVLQKVESLLRRQSGRADFVLADYFDYIAGTSTGGIVAGWATSVLHHSRWSRAPLSRLGATLAIGAGRLVGKVPHEVNRQLRYLPFREFCLLNAELEKASELVRSQL